MTSSDILSNYTETLHFALFMSCPKAFSFCFFWSFRWSFGTGLFGRFFAWTLHIRHFYM